ncbi:hypothetical protein M23134_06410 [Microscilla marina ATCC 23134]|uniref:Uncharacterized protein n=1 Tax=Microscilla marina ATCC 23134 TaxID=313606 RepID=A1ZU90_MICM2|nr:hypothetical protein M23134_06410 [Microscilla marina ATCC 23134]
MQLKDNSQAEQNRVRVIFEELKARATAGQELSPMEQEFFCRAVNISQLNDGNAEDYPCCSSYIFKMLYLAYAYDLSGGSRYYKPVMGRKEEVPRHEVNTDIAYLKQEADDWLPIVEKGNHSDQDLQAMAKEARYELKQLKKSTKYLLSGHRLRQAQIRRILLQTKFSYLVWLEIQEDSSQDDFILTLDGVDIEITPVSFFHIIGRHYALRDKAYYSEKSGHNESFHPRNIHKRLKTIFRKIDVSGVLAGEPIESIGFRYKGQDYLCWIKSKQKPPVSGNTGNISYNRLETFYLVEDAQELQKLEDNYILGEIDDELSVYVPL